MTNNTDYNPLPITVRGHYRRLPSGKSCYVKSHLRAHHYYLRPRSLLFKQESKDADNEHTNLRQSPRK